MGNSSGTAPLLDLQQILQLFLQRRSFRFAFSRRRRRFHLADRLSVKTVRRRLVVGDRHVRRHATVRERRWIVVGNRRVAFRLEDFFGHFAGRTAQTGDQRAKCNE